jgi:hypothetical protein
VGLGESVKLWLVFEGEVEGVEAAALTPPWSPPPEVLHSFGMLSWREI